jgi:hypothetical protein
VLAPNAQAGFAPGAQQLTGTVPQINVAVDAVDPAGNTAVAWDQVITPGRDQIVGRRIAADGSMGPLLSLSVTGVNSYNPAIAMSRDGHAFVAWGFPTSGASGSSLRGRWINPDGSLGPIVTLLDGSSTEDGVAVHVAIDANDVATVGWFNEAGGGNLIQLRRVGLNSSPSAQLDSSLKVVFGNFVIASLPGGSTFIVTAATTDVLAADGTFGPPRNASTSGNVQTAPTGIAFDSHGDGLIAWRRVTPANLTAEIARRIDPSGTPIGSEIVVDPDTAAFENDPVVAADSGGHFLVGWSTQDHVNAGEAHVRAVNLDGSFADVAHAASGTNEPVPNPRVALDDRGTGLAVYQFGPSNSNFLQGQPLGAGAAPFGGAAQLSSTNIGLDDLAYDPASGVATTVWTQRQVGGSNEALFARRFLEPPVCAGSRARVVQGRPIDVPLNCSGIAVNNALAIVRPKHGTLSAFDTRGMRFHYSPRPGFQGTDSFVYQGLNDGGASAGTTVTIAVGRDTVAPRVLKFTLVRTRHVLKRGKHRRVTHTYSFAFSFSEPSTVRVTIEKPVAGVVRRRRCRRAGPGAKGRHCTLYKTLATFSVRRLNMSATVNVPAGVVRQLAGKRRLRATAIATDDAGNASRPRRISVRFHLG